MNLVISGIQTQAFRDLIISFIIQVLDAVVRSHLNEVHVHWVMKAHDFWLENSDCLLVTWFSWPIGNWIFFSLSHKSHVFKSQQSYLACWRNWCNLSRLANTARYLAPWPLGTFSNMKNKLSYWKTLNRECIWWPRSHACTHTKIHFCFLRKWTRFDNFSN